MIAEVPFSLLTSEIRSRICEDCYRCTRCCTLAALNSQAAYEELGCDIPWGEGFPTPHGYPEPGKTDEIPMLAQAEYRFQL